MARFWWSIVVVLVCRVFPCAAAPMEFTTVQSLEWMVADSDVVAVASYQGLGFGFGGESTLGRWTQWRVNDPIKGAKAGEWLRVWVEPDANRISVQGKEGQLSLLFLKRVGADRNDLGRSEERRVGKEWRSRGPPRAAD